MGNPDWVAAVEEKVIAPRPGLEPEAAEAEIRPVEVNIRLGSDPAFAVTFSHREHGQWLACPNCHAGTFEMQAGATPMTPANVHSDKYCGACHGKVAFAIAGNCMSCHLRSAVRDSTGGVDWNVALMEKRIAPRAASSAQRVEQPVLDLDVEMKPRSQPAITTVFSHTIHTKWLACGSCHPRLFPAQIPPEAKDTSELHSRRYCGACHGTVSFGMIGACGRCHPALAKARQHQEAPDFDAGVTLKARPSDQPRFSHKAHRWVECPTCHSSLFATTPAATQIPKADIYGGKYCAACHGKVAADLIASCQHCHAAGGAP